MRSAAGERSMKASRSMSPAVFPMASKFDGVSGLQKALLSRPEIFATTLTEKLLTYASRPRSGVLRCACRPKDRAGSAARTTSGSRHSLWVSLIAHRFR